MSSSNKFRRSLIMNIKNIEIFDSLGLSFSAGAIKLNSAQKTHHFSIPGSKIIIYNYDDIILNG